MGWWAWWSSRWSDRSLAAEIKKRLTRLDVLTNNAGGSFYTRGVTSEGIEETLALNVLGLALWLLMELLAWAIERKTTKNVPRELARIPAVAVRSAGLGVSVISGTLAVALPLAQPRSPAPIVAFAFLTIAASVGLGFALTLRLSRSLARSGVQLPEGWNGLTYRNPRDPRLFVPKLVGIGTTLNFAHRKAWWLLAGLLAPPFLLLALILALAPR